MLAEVVLPLMLALTAVLLVPQAAEVTVGMGVLVPVVVREAAAVLVDTMAMAALVDQGAAATAVAVAV